MYKVGVYEREITALFGCSIRGYFNTRFVSGVKDKAYAKAVVIEKDGVIIALLAADMPKVNNAFCDAVYRKVEKYTPIKKENLTVAATHSHTTCVDKVGMYEGADDKLDGLYLGFLVEALADTVICAYQRLTDAKIKFAKTTVDGISFVRNYLLKNGVVRTNPGRLNPDIVEPFGKIDNEVPVFFFESKNGENLGLLYTFACHQDCVDGTEVSGDYSSQVSRRMKEKFGMNFVSIYFSGTAGNVNHFNVKTAKDAPDHYKKMGDLIAKRITEVLPNLTEVTGDITFKYENKYYRTRVPSKEVIKEKQEIFNKVKIPYGVKLDASSPVELFNACTARSNLKYAFSATAYTEAVWQIYKIGKIIIFAVSGEPFTQVGERIRKAFPDNECVFITNCNYDITYIPPKECYLPELYESLYGSAKLDPNDMEDFINKHIEIAKKL